MRLRKLDIKDINYISEWMNDPSINCFFRFSADKCNEESIKNFIISGLNDKENYHFAIVNNDDEYLGTVSLKNIDKTNKNAEYAISLRSCAMGKGIANFATKEILYFAFHKLLLNKVYLNVYSDNLRAIRFYEKVGFIYEGEFKKHLYVKGQYKSLKWYAKLKD